jgi:cytoskeletal protein RodZ
VHGFLEQYSKVLGLDFPNVIKPMLDEECPKDTFGKSVDELAIESANSSKLLSSIPVAPIIGGITFAVVVCIVIVLLISGGFSSKGSASRAAVTPPREITIAATPPVVTEPIPAPVIEPTPTPEPVAPVAQEAQVEAMPVVNDTPASTQPALRQTAMLEFSSDCWLYFIADGDNSTVQDFIATAGSEQRIYFDHYFMLHVGNAAALTVTHGTENYTNFGDQGRPLRDLYFTANENGHMVMSRNAPAE